MAVSRLRVPQSAGDCSPCGVIWNSSFAVGVSQESSPGATRKGAAHETVVTLAVPGPDRLRSTPPCRRRLPARLVVGTVLGRAQFHPRVVPGEQLVAQAA